MTDGSKNPREGSPQVGNTAGVPSESEGKGTLDRSRTEREGEVVRSALAAGPREGNVGTSSRSNQLLAAIKPVSRRARSFVGFFGTMASLSAVSALVLVLLIYLPFDPFVWWKAAAAVATMLVLGLPAVILFVFRLGLNQLVTLPERLVDTSTEVSVSTREAYAAVAGGSGKRFGTLLGFIQSIAKLRSLLFESREAIVGAALLVRVVNPIVLVVVLASLVLSGLLIAATVVAGAIAVF